ncbi:TetR/AcrR family transcriptional regulator [Streptomyces sp. ODS28]|uniref:TetR/AcrR family transcriptional regulator n=1 Tax=Streptomyces sp. ODS28 TaxID=3136688 RepID=UPI0031EBF61D
MRSENEPGGQPPRTEGQAEAKSGRGGRRSFIERARRAQIVEAAVEVLAARGYARASLAQIAERAGVSKGVISYHFAGKGELIERLVEQVYERIGEHVGARLQQEAEPGTARWIRVYVTAVAAYMQDHRTELRALGEIFTNHRTSEGEPRYGAVTSEPLYQRLEEVFRAGQESGAFRPFDTRVMAVSLQASIDAMFGYWSAYPEHDLAAHARELADLYVHATAAPDRTQ